VPNKDAALSRTDYGAFGINQLDEIAGYKVGKNPDQPRSLPYNPGIFDGNKWVVFDIAKLYPRGTRQGVYADRFILNAINDFGYTVGYKYRYGLAGTSAILIDVNDASDVVYLPTPAGGWAADINGNYMIVGTTGSNSRSVPVINAQAFLYDYALNNLLILPVLDAGLRSGAFDINEINEINQVVGSSKSASGYHTFIWDKTDGIVDLNNTVNEPGWVLSSAIAIIDNGDITGTGLHQDGMVHGFVLSNSTVSVPPPVLNQPHEAVASASVYSGKAALMVTFHAFSSTDPDCTVVGYSWDFKDGSFSTEVNPSHEFLNPGKYLVTLTVTDNQGLANSTQVEISVRNRKRN